MSQQFKESFGRDSEEDMLEYDDSAFYYFSISLMSFLLLPFTYGILKDAIFGSRSIEQLPGSCQCSRCRALITLKTKEAYSRTFNRAFYFRVMVAAFFWMLWYKNLEVVLAIESLQSFDPFTILGVGMEASIKDIKKAYRRLSLSMHPDKNPDNPLAVQEFIRLTKAYTVSTYLLANPSFHAGTH